MLENHDKVSLKTLDGQTLTRYFPDASSNDLEIGAELCPDDPHYGSALHREGYIKWGEGLIAKRDKDGFGMIILDMSRLKEAQL